MRQVHGEEKYSPPGPPTLEEAERYATLAWHDGANLRAGFAAFYPSGATSDVRRTCVVSRRGGAGRRYGWGFDVYVYGADDAKKLSRWDRVANWWAARRHGKAIAAAMAESAKDTRNQASRVW